MDLLGATARLDLRVRRVTTARRVPQATLVAMATTAGIWTRTAGATSRPRMWTTTGRATSTTARARKAIQERTATTASLGLRAPLDRPGW